MSADTRLQRITELQPGTWFRPPWSRHELWMKVVGEVCLRFTADGFKDATTIEPVVEIEIERPWFQVVRRKRPIWLEWLAMGQWFLWDGKPTLMVGGTGQVVNFGNDGSCWFSLPPEQIVYPLDVVIRTDRKSWWRKLFYPES